MPSPRRVVRPVPPSPHRYLRQSAFDQGYGGTSREFVEHLRNRGKFFDPEEKRERDLILIDYDDLNATPARRRNVYEVTEEWAFHNGH